MIRDVEAFKRCRVDESWRALARLSPSESLAIGMALWTSTLAAASRVTAEPRHLNYARQLGLSAERVQKVQAARPW